MPSYTPASTLERSRQRNAGPTQPAATKVAFMLVTTLFFMWGLSYGLLDVLNKHFQEMLHVSRAQSTLLQMAYFGAYFVMALPAGMLMERFGYKRGILLGLGLYALGALLFVPATSVASFAFFLFALFVIASGLACLETAANPYITVLGAPERSEQRLNLAQSFNGLGQVIGPAIGGLFFFGQGAAPESAAPGLGSVKITYVVIALIVLGLALAIWRTALPDIRGEGEQQGESAARSLLAQRHFVFGVVALFFYVAAQVGVGALFINAVTEQWPGMGSDHASFLLSVSFVLFMAGRFISTALMQRISATRLLTLYALINVALCLIVTLGVGALSVVALMAIFFFMSIMFPTIFALGVKALGAHTKRASSFLIMAIVGGAIMPFVMGTIADHVSTSAAYSVAGLCFVVVALYGWRGHRVRP